MCVFQNNVLDRQAKYLIKKQINRLKFLLLAKLNAIDTTIPVLMVELCPEDYHNQMMIQYNCVVVAVVLDVVVELMSRYLLL